MTHDYIVALQRALNRFTTKYLRYVTPLRVDGDYGTATKKRVRLAKYYLGYPVKERNAKAGEELLWRLAHPKRLNVKWASPARLASAAKRRIYQRHHAKKNVHVAASTTGVGHYDGVPCANWLIPYLTWARAHGWDGRLNSGWRDPVYSEHLCYAMCGRPSCPGRCAGRSSNHSGSVKPRGAVDVSDYVTFSRKMRECPLSPKLVNHLPRDPVHWSASGY